MNIESNNRVLDILTELSQRERDFSSSSCVNFGLALTVLKITDFSNNGLLFVIHMTIYKFPICDYMGHLPSGGQNMAVCFCLAWNLHKALCYNINYKLCCLTWNQGLCNISMQHFKSEQELGWDLWKRATAEVMIISK